MATIVHRTTQDGRITYLVRIRRKGSQPQTATFTKLSNAKRWAQMTEGAALEGRHFKSAEARRHTLADAVDRYLATVLPQKSASSIKMQTIQLTWWKQQLGYCVLADLSPARISEQRDLLLKSQRSHATVVRYLAALSHTLTVAIKEWNWLDDSPMRKVTKPREPRGRVRYLSDDERERLLTACRASRNPHLSLVVTLALSTGARKMELLSLTWRDIDVKRGAITLQKTKNGEARSLPLTGHALDRMRNHAKVRRLDTALVFPDGTGTQPMDIRTAWAHAVQRAGIADFRFHDLRHCAASYLAMSGASLLEIAEVLGHKTLQMTRRYTHLSQDHTFKVVERMNAAIFGDR